MCVNRAVVVVVVVVDLRRTSHRIATIQIAGH